MPKVALDKAGLCRLVWMTRVHVTWSVVWMKRVRATLGAVWNLHTCAFHVRCGIYATWNVVRMSRVRASWSVVWIARVRASLGAVCPSQVCTPRVARFLCHVKRGADDTCKYLMEVGGWC